MSNKSIENNEPLLEGAIIIYLAVVEDANMLKKTHVVTEAHELIHRNNYKTETDYYTALTEYIMANI